ncbi:ribose-5-phosphate isomerase [Flavobacteriales bacterium]|nr:ribose-5-phosphate isomerase [Flavobacteriales bacterium]
MAYCIYAIGLKTEVIERKRFLEANPNDVKGKPCHYVGSTSLSPEERAEQHRTAYRNSDGKKLFNTYAHEHFDGLRPRQYDRFNPSSTRKEAEQIEAELAVKLRKRGFGIWSH